MELFADLERIIQGYLPEDKVELVRRAFVIARDAHEGQFRSSGEPYITHPVSVASIIAKMNLDHEAVMAALLHDVIEDTPYTEENLKKEFGASVADIVEGVSKLDKLKFRTRQEAQVENFRKMILAMTRDIRVVLIKLADRTHNMRTLGALRPDKRRRIAKETLEIYCPLAHRLGIEHIKNELEDLSFEAMYPHRYKVLKKLVEVARNNRQDLIERISSEIKERLENVGIVARVWGREKHLYKIYQKMRAKDQEFHSIMDIYAFRIIVKNIDDCYRVLGQMHNLYKPRPGRVKDYIAVPKANGYQSLQTSMIGPHGVPVEVHIHTEDMEQVAEMGVTAYWVYKESGKNDSTTAQIRAQRWLQNLVEIQQSVGNSFEFIENVKSEFFPKEIFVFTPKGRIVELPKGATAVDFAYAVHSDIGNTCVGVMVEYKPYPLSKALESGQTVNVLTDPNAHPNASWLNFVVTARAKTRIRHYLKQRCEDDAVKLGERELNAALQPHRLSDLSLQQIQTVLDERKLSSLEGLLREIGLGNQLASAIAHQLVGESIEIDVDGNTENHSNTLTIAPALMANMQFAKCCHPIPNDPIMGCSTLNHGLIIHHQQCENLRNAHQLVKAKWEKMQSAVNFDAELQIEILNEKSALPSLMTAIGASESSIQNIWTEGLENNLLLVILQISVKDTKHLANILYRIKRITGVVSAKRNINA
ncbi:bifunctional GTP diphosphokinase/guanosine-3',5'-bis pyrophosphate 3'-pyrophosphohydrolase [Rodentibacter pneumotropicus]|uniref:guanosine-3',5'-bis(diphosphate) 3'-diphosphatase n=1 Tax=Rodentibacter pneumotropicus TaxID=758 RepID=A0AAW5LDA4_9PAST|nr:bifunctional GTP diphosphokinase/guanosine-3',5'-bis pyrophosphate 3'-pyrophosphohydrolase [Rodentibacter pneumotropicus]MCQ9122038.1 bifunctional GTP diphosphokinase/guanosine-3',5'-bis pyrophosphate 3'-pyrophosphohydrolase [Rodentibacter pneumotropicus]OOF61543.1 bifunctional GTP diphosphokinase/guanosine-3',5'-bis(diphosphate) 3'-diphosphatase [Rodentibacter pneumotropicus]OOF67233.1 bifunctional GTP diphosphokinase/guanosine-3',5'-bis(diphosphate) 3'-diphosphatase [Rodentibacter pneumotro